MKIDQNINLVLPVVSRDVTKPDPEKEGKTLTVSEPLVWAYHTPISTEVFAANYRIIAKTNAAIFSEGLRYAATAGRRISKLTLLDISEQDAAAHDSDDLGPALIQEIKRLTLVLAPGTNGFEMLPVDAAIARNAISQDDWDEAESEIIFFTLAYAMSRRAGRMTFCGFLASVMEGSITSSSPTEFAASLRESTPVSTSEPQVQAALAEPSEIPQ